MAKEFLKGEKNKNAGRAGPGVNSKIGKKKKRHVSVKGQMRSLQRLLNKEGLNPKVKKAEEAKLEALRQQYEQNKQNERDRQLAKRYHMAKFFERVKIERMIDKAKKEVAKADSSAEVQAAAAAKLARIQEDLQYVTHFPKGEKFVSLLKEAETPEAQALLDRERARLRELVRRQMADEVLLTEANEGRRDASPAIPAQEPVAQVAAPKAASLKKGQLAAERSKGKPAVAAKGPKVHAKKVEAAVTALATAPRAAEGTMAEEDDFFMHSGGEGDMPDSAPPAQPQGQSVHAHVRAHPEARKPTGNASSAEPKREWSKPKATRPKPSGNPQRSVPKFKKPREEPSTQKEKAATRTRAEGGRKRRKKTK